MSKTPKDPPRIAFVLATILCGIAALIVVGLALTGVPYSTLSQVAIALALSLHLYCVFKHGFLSTESFTVLLWAGLGGLVGFVVF